jgi:ceramide glucosyltransferase
VAPLSDARVGAATTFRWLLPRNGGFWSALVAAWNAPIATHLGEHNHNFCWGGGTAIRRERFEEVQALEAWRGSVSDDFSLTQALRACGLRVEFVPECLVASQSEMTARQFAEFTTRQLIITRVYDSKLWVQAFVGHGLYSATVLVGLCLWAFTWAAGFPSFQLLLLVMLPPIIGAFRGMVRLTAVLELMPESRVQILRFGWAWTLLAPLVPFVFLYGSCVAAFRVAAFRRTIMWRGTCYLLVSAQQTRVITPHSRYS